MTKSWPYFLSLILFSLAAIYVCAAYYLTAYSADVPLHINEATRIWHGEVLYRDIITPNFPMQFYLRIPGVAIAETLHANSLRIARIFDSLAALLCFGLTLHIWRKSWDWTVVALPTAALLYVLLFFPALRQITGQKEYFFFLFTLPYFSLLTSREVSFSRSLRIAIGLLAAIGFCYKPHFAIPFLLVVTAARGWRRAESIACVLFAALYVLWMLICTPYAQTMLPIAHYYLETGRGLFEIGVYYVHHLWFALLVLGLIAYGVRHTQAHSFLNIYVLAALGEALAAILQMKLFYYHLYPFFATLLIISSFALALFIRQPSRRWAALTAFICLALIAPIPWVGDNIITGYEQAKKSEHDADVLDYLSWLKTAKHIPGELTFYSFDEIVGLEFPEGFYRGIPWDYHFSSLWLYRGLKNDPNEKMDEYLRQTVTADIARLHPQFLLFNRRQADFKSYFSQNAEFKTLMQNYLLIVSQGKWDIYVDAQAH